MLKFAVGLMIGSVLGLMIQNAELSHWLVLVIGLFCGGFLVYMAIYKLFDHAALKALEEEKDDADWWKEGRNPPY